MTTAARLGPERLERLLLSERELTEALGLESQRTVARLRHGGLPVVLLPVPGRQRPIIRYDPEAVKAWIARHMHGDLPAPASPAPVPAPARRGRHRHPAPLAR